MRIILFSLLTLIHSYILPKPKSRVIVKNKKCFDQEYEKYKKIIYLEQNYIKNNIKGLTNKNLETIKYIIDDEDVYSTEWDFHNQTWKK